MQSITCLFVIAFLFGAIQMQSSRSFEKFSILSIDLVTAGLLQSYGKMPLSWNIVSLVFPQQ